MARGETRQHTSNNRKAKSLGTGKVARQDACHKRSQRLADLHGKTAGSDIYLKAMPTSSKLSYGVNPKPKWIYKYYQKNKLRYNTHTIELIRSNMGPMGPLGCPMGPMDPLGLMTY